MSVLPPGFRRFRIRGRAASLFPEVTEKKKLKAAPARARKRMDTIQEFEDEWDVLHALRDSEAPMLVPDVPNVMGTFLNGRAINGPHAGDAMMTDAETVLMPAVVPDSSQFFIGVAPRLTLADPSSYTYRRMRFTGLFGEDHGSVFYLDGTPRELVIELVNRHLDIYS